MAKLLQNGTVVTFDNTTDSIRVLPKASILTENGRIAAITENGDPPHPHPENTTVIDVRGKIITPGFINTHTHMWQTVYRSMGPNVTLAEYFGWTGQFSPATALFTPDDIHTSCLEGYMEGLHAGVTSFVEHAHNNWSREAVEPGLQAAVQSGARVWWCYDVMQRDGFSRSEQWELLEGIGRSIGSEPKSLVQLGLAADGLSGCFREDPEGHVGHAREMIKKLNMQAITIHHLGGPWPTPNSSPSQLCASGLQNSKVPVIFSHAPFLTDEDQKALRDNDLSVSITPESESHYGHGQKTGSRITDKASLGIDTNWTFSGDILSQARFWLQHVRLTNYQTTLVESGKIPNANPFPVDEAFLLATRQGGRALRRDDIGVVQVGAKADLVVFNGDSPNMLGWSNPVAAVMLHANPGDVEHVLVDGEFRKRDFKLVDDGGSMGWTQVRTRFAEAARRIQSQMADPPTLGKKLWGVSEFGDVERVSTKPCGCTT